MSHLSKLFCLTILISFTLTSNAQTFSSGENHVSVLELYTSEGCSSCPPADKWLSKLKQDKRLWKTLIPMAFHVDYWDYIGWKDRFASPRNSQRQRLYARQNHLSTVYTPGMLLNGSEWRSWYYQRPLKLESSMPAGILSIGLNDQKISATYTPASSTKENLVLNIAILGFDLSTAIKAGENRGRHLQHDFVVLGQRSVRLPRLPHGYSIKQTELPKTNLAAKRIAIAAWVSSENDLSPIQATGGWLDQ